MNKIYVIEDQTILRELVCRLVLENPECERELLQLIAEGNTTREIAAKLDISVKTADSHRTNVMNKLDIHDIAGLTRFAIQNGLVEA